MAYRGNLTLAIKHECTHPMGSRQVREAAAYGSSSAKQPHGTHIIPGHPQLLELHSSWTPCTQQAQTSFRNSLWEHKSKAKEPGDPERKEENSYTTTTGRECNRHQAILQLEDLGVNQSSNLTKDGKNYKKHESCSSGTEWIAPVTLGWSLHKHHVAQKLHPEPTSFKIHTDKGAHMGNSVAAVQYLQLRNGTWNTSYTEHNTSKSTPFALMEVAALNSRHQISAWLFLLWALHQLLSTRPVSLEEVKHREKRQENAK